MTFRQYGRPLGRPLFGRLMVGILQLALGGALLAVVPARAGEPLAQSLAAQAWPHAADAERSALAAFCKADLGAAGAEKVASGTVDFDLDSLRLALDVDPDARVIRGQAALRLTCAAEALSRVVLDLISTLTVDSVRTDRGPAGFTQAGDTLAIDLGFTLVKGNPAWITIWYGGTPGSVFDLGFTFRIHHLATTDPDDDGPVASSLSQPEYAHFWWPCKDHPDDKFISEVAVTVPESLVAVSNGTLVSAEKPSGGRWTWTWRSKHPIATYLVSVAVSDYVTFGETCESDLSGAVPLQHWVFPPTLERARVDFAPLCGMLRFLEGKLGAYPFADEKYGHAEFLWSGAMEHQTVTSYGSILLPGNNVYDTILLHELAHQWLGDAVTPRSWADIWLNEGFATYCEALWAEHEWGAAGYFAFMDAHDSYDDWAGESTVYDPFPIFPGRVIYDKGAWILHMLRGRMGDGPFFDLLLSWATEGDRLYGLAGNAEFVALASQFAGEDLGSFFDPWLNTDLAPRLRWRQEAVDGPNGAGTTLRLELAQTQTVLFDNVYPVRVTTAAGIETVRAQLAGRTGEFTFDLPGRIETVELDPQRWVCWRADTSALPSGVITAVYPNPAQAAPVSIAFRLSEAAEVTLRVYDLRGRLVAVRRGGMVEPALTDRVLTWDGRDDDGRPAPSGVYWAQLRLGGRTAVRRFTLAR